MRTLRCLLVSRRAALEQGREQPLSVPGDGELSRARFGAGGHRVQKLRVRQQQVQAARDRLGVAHRHDESIHAIAYDAARVGCGDYGQSRGESFVADGGGSLAQRGQNEDVRPAHMVEDLRPGDRAAQLHPAAQARHGFAREPGVPHDAKLEAAGREARGGIE